MPPTAEQIAAAQALDQATQRFAEAQRATGQGAAAVSGQQQVANQPIREALETASNLAPIELPTNPAADPAEGMLADAGPLGEPNRLRPPMLQRPSLPIRNRPTLSLPKANPRANNRPTDKRAKLSRPTAKRAKASPDKLNPAKGNPANLVSRMRRGQACSPLSPAAFRSAWSRTPPQATAQQIAGPEAFAGWSGRWLKTPPPDRRPSVPGGSTWTATERGHGKSPTNRLPPSDAATVAQVSPRRTATRQTISRAGGRTRQGR
ncbi:MAG: hypothetical protein R3C99_13540 [Pirellulaceae bacterium]